MGIVLTMFDSRNNLSHQVVSEIQQHFQEKVFQSIIPRNVRLSEAPSHGQTIHQYDPKSLGAKKYKELAYELDARVFGELKKDDIVEKAVAPEVPKVIEPEIEIAEEKPIELEQDNYV